MVWKFLYIKCYEAIVRSISHLCGDVCRGVDLSVNTRHTRHVNYIALCLPKVLNGHLKYDMSSSNLTPKFLIRVELEKVFARRIYQIIALGLNTTFS